MKCNEFRQLLLEDPRGLEREALDHAQNCEACGREYARALAFEDSLLEALQVKKPEDLESRLILAHELSAKKSLLGLPLDWMPVAAGLMLLVVFAGWMGFQWGGSSVYADGLSATVLQHIDDEAAHLAEKRDIPGTELAAHFSRFGGVMVQNMGQVDFASPCWIRKQMGLHLVVTDDQGPVTILLMPGEYVREKEIVDAGEFTGVILPTSYGSMAVIGSRQTSVDAAVQRVQEAVLWGI